MAVNINIPSEVTQTITDGVTTTAPSENAVFDALALKANSADLALVATTGDYNDLDNLPILNNGTVTSVDLTMPSAFSVSGNPVTSSGTLAVAAAGLSSQYIRGDGQLANFPTSSGGGSSVNFYLNGSVAQGTLGGVAFKQMSSSPVIGTGTDFTINADGYIQSFITDASVPNQLSIPGGNWNFEMYFSASSNGGTPRFYVELYKLSGGILTLLASSSANPEYITNGTQIDLYTTALAVPSTVLLAADRLAVRVYVIHSSKTITLHTENSHLCQVITTFSTGLTALNGLTSQVQNLAVGTSGTDFAISSATNTHTFNLPTASASNRGALSTSDWTAFNGKQAALVSGTNIKTINGTSLLGSGDITVGGGITVGTTAVTSGTIGRVFFQGTGDVVQQSASLFWDNTNARLGVGATPDTSTRLDIRAQGTASTDVAFRVRNTGNTYNIIASYGNELTIIGRNESTEPRLLINRAGSTKMILGGTADLNISFLSTGKGEINSGAQGLDLIATSGEIRTRTASTYTLLSGNFFGIGRTPAARLDVQAQGALSTDIAFRVRNSADSQNILSVRGNGTLWSNGAGFIQSNTAFGEEALDANTSGFWNTAFGYKALTADTTGVQNTAFGFQAGQSLTTANQTTAIGSGALENATTTSGNTAVGFWALRVTTSGDNTALGLSAMQANVGGTRNLSLGANSMQANVGGSDNVVGGWYAAGLLTSGSSNVFLGMQAGYFFGAGSNLTASTSSILIGQDTRPLANSQSNQIVIGHNAIGAGSNTATIGNTSIVKTILRGTLNAANLPTSPAGLVTGDIWNNLGILTIV